MGLFLQYNDNVPARRRFYQALDVVLDITLRSDLDLENYLPNLTRMYGEEIIGNASASVSGETRFFGLAPTNMKLDGQGKHLKLLESYEKLQVVRAAFSLKTK